MVKIAKIGKRNYKQRQRLLRHAKHDRISFSKVNGEDVQFLDNLHRSTLTVSNSDSPIEKKSSLSSSSKQFDSTTPQLTKSLRIKLFCYKIM